MALVQRKSNLHLPTIMAYKAVRAHLNIKNNFGWEFNPSFLELGRGGFFTLVTTVMGFLGLQERTKKMESRIIRMDFISWKKSISKSYNIQDSPHNCRHLFPAIYKRIFLFCTSICQAHWTLKSLLYFRHADREKMHRGRRYYWWCRCIHALKNYGVRVC